MKKATSSEGTYFGSVMAMDVEDLVSFNKLMPHPRACAAGIVLVLLGVPSLSMVAALSLLQRNAGGPDSSRPQHTDVLVVLAGHAERDAYAAWLVKHGFSSRVLSTRVDPHCLRGGESRETCLTGIRNTIDEALVMRRILMAGQTQHATVVTSRYHLLRAAAVFRIGFAGSGIDLDFIDPPESEQPPARVIMTEWLKLGPSIGAVIIGRMAPNLYELLMRTRDGGATPSQCEDVARAVTEARRRT